MEGSGLPQLTEDMVGRHFSNAVVTWKISNLTLALCPPGMQINSPDFTLSGPVDTQWRMSLDISRANDRILLYLEMLPHEISNLRATVNFRANVMDPVQSSEIAVVVEREHTFEPNFRLTVEMFQLMGIVRQLTQASPDALRMRCNIMVQFGYNPRFPKASSNGLMSLSHDLSQLPSENLYSDVKVKGHGCEFQVHRGMLCHRSDSMNSLLQTAIDGTLGLYLTDNKALDAMFAYLYSGDLFYVLSQPTIMIYDYIERFGIAELKNAYPVEKFKVESIIGVNEYEFEWTVSDFTNVKERLASPVLEQKGMDSLWRLHLNPNGEGSGIEPQKNFLYIDAELVDSTRPLHVSLEFICVDKNNDPLQSRRTHEKMSAGDRLGLEFFKVGGSNMERCLVEGVLYLRFKIRIATGETIPLLTEIMPSAPLEINNERTFMILSQMMGALLTYHYYSDVTLLVDGEYFKAHKFVLSVRSPLFRRLLQNSSRESSGTNLTIPNVKKRPFKVFLEFLYTGILNDAAPEVVIDLYDVSSTFHVISLKSVCTDLLVARVNTENVLQFLLWADDRKENAVKIRALQVVALLVGEIQNYPDWADLTGRPQLLAAVVTLLGAVTRDPNVNVLELAEAICRS